MSWSGDLPFALAGKPYSVRWTGRLVPEEDGQHTLVVMGKGAIRLILDGRTVIDGTSRAAAADGADGAVSFKEHAGDARFEVPLTLARGRARSFTLEQRQPTADAVSLWFEWITPSQRRRMTLPDEKAVEVYLPAGQDWYDFAGGDRHEGGRTIRVVAPLDHMPVFARAGAIIPMTPGIDRAAARPEAIDLRIYDGRNGSFTLYDDEGDGAGYRSGAAARIPLRWDTRSRMLSIGPRAGSYPGMPQRQMLRVQLIDGRTSHPVRSVRFDGAAQTMSWPA